MKSTKEGTKQGQKRQAYTKMRASEMLGVTLTETNPTQLGTDTVEAEVQVQSQPHSPPQGEVPSNTFSPQINITPSVDGTKSDTEVAEGAKSPEIQEQLKVLHVHIDKSETHHDFLLSGESPQVSPKKDTLPKGKSDHLWGKGDKDEERTTEEAAQYPAERLLIKVELGVEAQASSLKALDMVRSLIAETTIET